MNNAHASINCSQFHSTLELYLQLFPWSKYSHRNWESAVVLLLFVDKQIYPEISDYFSQIFYFLIGKAKWEV